MHKHLRFIQIINIKIEIFLKNLMGEGVSIDKISHTKSRNPKLNLENEA